MPVFYTSSSQANKEYSEWYTKVMRQKGFFRAIYQGDISYFQKNKVKSDEINEYYVPVMNTLLSYAAYQYQTEIALLLLKHPNINVNLRGSIGKTPLCQAAYTGNVALVSGLLKIEHLDINAADPNGRTALHFACLNGNLEMVQLLLKHPKIKTNIKDIYHQSARNLAQRVGHAEIVRLLVTHDVAPYIKVKQAITRQSHSGSCSIFATVSTSADSQGLQTYLSAIKNI